MVRYGRTIQVNFTAFSIQGNAGSCTADYVEVSTVPWSTVRLRLETNVDFANDLSNRLHSACVLIKVYKSTTLL